MDIKWLIALQEMVRLLGGILDLLIHLSRLKSKNKIKFLQFLFLFVMNRNSMLRVKNSKMILIDLPFIRGNKTIIKG